MPTQPECLDLCDNIRDVQTDRIWNHPWGASGFSLCHFLLGMTMCGIDLFAAVLGPVSVLPCDGSVCTECDIA